MRYLHTMLRVRNLDVALKFYRDALGLKEVRRIENDKGRFTLVFLCAAEDENALIQASGQGHLNVVKLLIARGANVNVRAFAQPSFDRPDGEWRTPLGMARRSGHADVVMALVAAGGRE